MSSPNTSSDTPQPTHGNHGRAPIHIHITARPPENVYTSGDLVQGIARIDPKSRPQRITLVFRGYSQTNVQRPHRYLYSAEPDLFSHTLELFSSSTKEESYDIVSMGLASDGRVELPFSFMFPAIVELDPYPTKNFWKKRADFESEKGYQLPPSFESAQHYSMSQRIEYVLEALMYTKRDWRPDVVVRQRLEFVPPISPPNPLIPSTVQNKKSVVIREEIIRTHKLHNSRPEDDSNESKLKRLKHSITGNKDVPWAKFRLDATCPRTLITGGVIPITINLKHLERSKELVDPPPVYLRRIRVQFFTSIKIRAPHPHPSKNPATVAVNEDFTDSRWEPHEVFDKKFTKDTRVLLYDGLALEDLVSGGEAPRLSRDTCTGGFKSYAINLEYEIHISLVVECAGEKFESIGCWGPVDVVSDKAVRSIVDDIAGDVVGGQGVLDAHPPSEELPPYRC